MKNKINTFKELMDLITYDWGNASELIRNSDGTFTINKTYIEPTFVSYKVWNWKITNPMVFKKLEKFYELLQESDAEKILYSDNRSK